MIDSAFDTIEEKMNVELDRKNKKFPKMKYKGQARPLIIRPKKNEKNKPKNEESDEKLNFPYPPIPEVSKQTGNNATSIMPSPKEDEPVVPKYSIVHRGYFDMTNFTGKSQATSMPKELVVEIELPMAKSASGLDLDIFTQQLVLNSEKPSYHLDIKLPYKVDEDRGKAQFDKTKKILTVTLPIVKPTEVTEPQTLVQECPPENSDANEHEDGTTSQPRKKNMTLPNGGEVQDKPCSDNVQTVNDVNDDDSNSEAFEEITMEDVDAIDLTNATFDTKNLESMPLNSRLPPYSFDQTQDTMMVVVKVPGVQVANVSLGITAQQVCLSIPQDPVCTDSADWNMVIRLDDRFFLNADECGFEVYDDRMELNLKKSCIGLWDRFFIGVSETSLEMELFLTNETATEMVEKLKALSIDKLPRARVEDEDERKAMSMEKQLERLLEEQEKQSKSNEIKYKKCESNPRFSVGSVSEGSDVDLTQIDLMDLANDVIDENSPIVSPLTATETFKRNNRPFGRSYSSDDFNPRLRSILKRSKSDGAANTTDTDDDGMCQRSRAITYSDGYMNHSESEGELSRRRNKSVSFQEEPTVFEFIKMTKWEWKKRELMRRHEERKAKKEKKEKNASSTEQTASSADEDKPKEEATPPAPEEKPVVQKQEKHGKKWKKAQKARNRNNSESRSEEEADKKGQTQKKGKRKKKNKKGANLNFPTNSGSDSGCVEGKSNPSLNNPLIFELD